MRIAIVGAGPAGSWAATLLAANGHVVTLVDSQAPWEKPCGGGVTTRALRDVGVFGTDLPKRNIDRISITFDDTSSVSITPHQPLAVVSRADLGRHLLQSAQRSGVHFLQDRITAVAGRAGAWRLTTRGATIEADYLIGADGASSLVRRSLATPFAAEDLSMTLGYFIPASTHSYMKIHFLSSLEGYVWSFPRMNHLSYGIITRIEPGWTARAKALLHNFIIADLGREVLDHAEFYSAPVPSLKPSSWKGNQVSGNGWALIGDAAGFVDPITGEGIYYAFRSAQILADTFPAGERYAERVSADFARELAWASRLYRRFYHGRFIGGDFRKRMVQIAHRSRTMRAILGDVLTGNQSYLELKRKLVFSAPAVVADLIAGRA